MEFIEILIASSGSATFIASTCFILLKYYKADIDKRLDGLSAEVSRMQIDISRRIEQSQIDYTNVKIDIAKISSSLDMLAERKNIES
ncbi:hypothetical protein N8Z24_00660 [bacterium]|nr:hypothetical protein [bacterium]